MDAASQHPVLVGLTRHPGAGWPNPASGCWLAQPGIRVLDGPSWHPGAGLTGPASGYVSFVSFDPIWHHDRRQKRIPTKLHAKDKDAKEVDTVDQPIKNHNPRYPRSPITPRRLSPTSPASLLLPPQDLPG
jgi:hypothetical protein